MTDAGEFFREIGGVPHHVRVEGSGPVCVLSAGLAMGWFDWEPVAALLAPYRTVVRFDRPGHGLSGAARVAPTAAGEAQRIAAVVDAVRTWRASGAGAGADAGVDAGARADAGVDADADVVGPVTVVGHSIAGFHAEAFARLYPERTASVVLVDSST
ncbi:alpha/beta fold hydrolase, partial [Streptomyces sp. NPDC054863]